MVTAPFSAFTHTHIVHWRAFHYYRDRVPGARLCGGLTWIAEGFRNSTRARALCPGPVGNLLFTKYVCRRRILLYAGRRLSSDAKYSKVKRARAGDARRLRTTRALRATPFAGSRSPGRRDLLTRPRRKALHAAPPLRRFRFFDKTFRNRLRACIKYTVAVVVVAVIVHVRNPFITEQWRLGVYNGLHIVFERAARTANSFFFLVLHLSLSVYVCIYKYTHAYT